MEHNYYAKYFSEISDWCGVGYGIILGSRGLTCGFAGGFVGNFFRGVSAAHAAGDQSGAWAGEDRGAGGAELRAASEILGMRVGERFARGACPLIA